MYRCLIKYCSYFLLTGIFSLTPLISFAVTVTETFDIELGEGRYTVNNDSNESIFAFVVGNNSATFADGGQFNQDLPSPDVWDWDIISREDWESNQSFFGFGAGEAWTVPNTSTLDWNSIFGAETTQAIGYWVLEDPGSIGSLGTSTPVAPGETRSHFTFEAYLPGSPFIAFGQAGDAIDQGDTSPVPVPAAIWLFISGFLGIFGLIQRNSRL